MEENKENIENVENVENKENVEVINEAPTSNDKKGISIAAMVLGICALVVTANFFLSVACGVLAVVFGVKGKNGCKPKFAKAGLIMGIIALALQVVLFVIGFIIGLAAVGAVGSLLF